MYTIPIVFGDIGGHALIQQIPYFIMKNLSYHIIPGMDWLRSTNQDIDSRLGDLLSGIDCRCLVAHCVFSASEQYYQYNPVKC